MSTRIQVQITGMDETAEVLQAIRSGLSNRRGLHTAMAVPAQEMTQEFLLKMNRHRSAERLGARPTKFRQKNAKLVEADADDSAAYVRIPRNTGLGRSFHDVDLVPRNGKKYLTIPADARTYGKSVRQFPEGTFKFAILHAHRPFPVLLFKSDDRVAYWLRKTVHQAQDRSLLPSDAAYAAIGRRAAITYIQNLIEGGAAA